MMSMDSQGKQKRVIIIGTDGMRPDLADPNMMPTFSMLSKEGTRFYNFTAAYPPHTRVSMTTLTTGTHPGKHGVIQNLMYRAGFGEDGLVQTGNHEHLLSYKEQMSEPFILRSTLGDRLHNKGKKLAVAGSSSPGASLLWNINHPEMVINPSSTYGVPELAEIHDKMGPVPVEQGKTMQERAEWATRALIDNWLLDEENQVMVLWLSEPDASQHAYGLGSEEAYESMRTVDRCVRWIIDELKRLEMDDRTNVFWISDHGHSTVNPQATLADHVKLASEVLEINTQFVVADNLIYADAPDTDIESARRLATWLLEQPWCNIVFSSAPEIIELPGVLPHETVVGEVCHDRLPLLAVSVAWSNDTNEFGVSGEMMTLTSSTALKSQHGSLSPYDLRALCLAYGPDFGQGQIVETPCGLIDIAPTVCDLLGYHDEQGFDGKSLLKHVAMSWQEKTFLSDLEQRGVQVVRSEHSFYHLGSVPYSVSTKQES